MSMMTAGAHWDTMDNFTNFYNFRKMVGLESALLKKIVSAIPKVIIHARAFSEFTEVLKGEYQSQLTLWQEQVVKWEEGMSDFCPYNVTEPEITIAKIKKAMAEEDHHREMA
ncbi:hypothetical protein AAF712_016849, partial [Marasmius tenuissimus]